MHGEGRPDPGGSASSVMRSATAVRFSRVRISPPRNDSGTVNSATTDSHSKHVRAEARRTAPARSRTARMTMVAPELR